MNWKRCFPLILLLALVAACQTVPITGRQQLNLVSSETIQALGNDAYQEYMASHKVGGTLQQRQMVEKVGQKVVAGVRQYFRQSGRPDELSGYVWNFTLAEDQKINAFALPGGKVVVNTGLLRIADNDSALATVISHEIAHVVARHGSERMSQALLAQLGGEVLSSALTAQPDLTRSLFLQAYGLGAQVGVLLPFSRTQETEADHLGLVFMAIAGYNPEAALRFWERMMAEKEGGSTPEWLRTHPTDQQRIANIRQVLPEAKKYYVPTG
jgi:predicted Zn-dependent protease